MTVIVGANLITEFAMIADTRVSWPTATSRSPQDILQKLYPIAESNNFAVLGFSGRLSVAKIIIKCLKERKFNNFRREFIMEVFKDSLQKWIEEITIREIPRHLWGSVKFMLGGVEPRRHSRIVDGNKIIGFIPQIPEIHIYAYSTNKNTGQVSVTRKISCAIIGSGGKYESAVEERIARVNTLFITEPGLQWAKPVILTDMIARVYRKRDEITVGGPFQLIRITQLGMEQHYIWHTDESHSNVDVRQELTSTVISHPDLKASYNIQPIWHLDY
jgi:hypothetical protein